MIPVVPACPDCGYPVPEHRAPCGRCGGRVRDPGDRRPIRPLRAHSPAGLWHGFWDFLGAAWHLFNRKAYFGRLLLPTLINLLVIGGMIFAIWKYSLNPVDALLAMDWGGVEWLKEAARWTSWAIAGIASIIVGLAVAPLVVEVLFSPFLNGLLDATEEDYIGRKIDPVKLGFMPGLRLEARAIARLLLWQILFLPLLLLLSLTGIGGPIAFLLAAWLHAIAWFDLPASRRGYGLKQRGQLLRQNWPLALGFGLGAQIGLMVPVFNILFWAPAAAVGASVAFFRMEKSMPRLQEPSQPATTEP
ncbi:MAG: EI24 domain-containing protein [Planctomycetota bacterium]